DRARAAQLRQLESDPPAERAARHVRPIEPELVEELRDESRERVRTRCYVRRLWWRVAEPRQVDRDHVALGGQSLEHRLPHLPAAADAVDQHERLARTGAMKVERHELTERYRY